MEVAVPDLSCSLIFGICCKSSTKLNSHAPVCVEDSRGCFLWCFSMGFKWLDNRECDKIGCPLSAMIISFPEQKKPTGFLLAVGCDDLSCSIRQNPVEGCDHLSFLVSVSPS